MQMNMKIFFLTCGRQAHLIFQFNIPIISLVLILNRPILNKLKTTFFIHLGKLDPTVLFSSYRLVCLAKFLHLQ